MSTTTDADVAAADWLHDDFDFWAFDRRMDGRRGDRFFVVLSGTPEELAVVGEQVATRCQRLLDWRNGHSLTPRFDMLLELHEALHDLDRPLVRADFDHALDVWQWVLRLEPEASFAIQAAALLHDIERLDSEALRRIEHLEPDYQRFKDRHAAGGAARARQLLQMLGFEEADEVAALIEEHEHRPGLLSDADALSFFSLNSPGFFDYYPHEHALRKVDYTLRRLSPSRLPLLNSIRLRGDVAAAIRNSLQRMTA
jgi:hypothetical protein